MMIQMNLIKGLRMNLTKNKQNLNIMIVSFLEKKIYTYTFLNKWVKKIFKL